ncbi:uracil-DNA glycosylase family protein [Desulfohalobium retbaense]|uniref:Uracil-DNA glycosylase superfamily n=1 Tax=Desulfohalobium retbaense (strain ATCC 49708 / DSM 5692 / JCM 16813 / HR100) TaxID=485915 RepID=C8X2H2_DESRD|nr:uracil-DNA glycosylase family protein [Desulfohalobium retbaense]ACV68619.1 Uracil-DNA glycosylase superfamily [Desulfohalobium retbaense DSM 5692]
MAKQVLPQELADIALRLCHSLSSLSFSAPVTHVYNPLEYAWRGYRSYLEYAAWQPPILLVGMNPGPWGMAQTGVPFGDKDLVSSWLGITAAVNRPPREHPKRPVQGFDCPRGEVSGQRLWGWARDRFGSPERFFQKFFVANYCPLSFMEESGRNRTPDKLPVAERKTLFHTCDSALEETVRLIAPEWVLGIGKFAAGRAAAACRELDVRIESVPHPSPASPLANQGWSRLMDARLAELGCDGIRSSS